QICKVQVAGEIGADTVLIQARNGSTMRLTALDVVPGHETAMGQRFIDRYARGGAAIGKFRSRDVALRRAHALCRKLTQAAGAQSMAVR
ncbi:MAG TPA: hypothetical protein VMX97_12735, partial [Hyphomicrobiaceae bacterium]|nr:hypothetical protein [Hyphomicrobiaceae bacterium]